MLYHWITALTLAPLIAALGIFSQALLVDFTEQTMSYDGQEYPLAPSITQMTRAARLNDQWLTELKQAAALFVLGGAHGDPSDKTAAMPCLKMDYADPSLPELRPLFSLNSSYDFWQKIKDHHGAALDWREGFSAVCIAEHITAVLQLRVRRDAGYVFYDTTLHYGDQLQAQQSYHYCLRRDEAAWDLPPGATHYWYSTDEISNKHEESGVCLVLPDPYLLPGTMPKAFSRFTYFEHVLR